MRTLIITERLQRKLNEFRDELPETLDIVKIPVKITPEGKVNRSKSGLDLLLQDLEKDNIKPIVFKTSELIKNAYALAQLSPLQIDSYASKHYIREIDDDSPIM